MMYHFDFLVTGFSIGFAKALMRVIIAVVEVLGGEADGAFTEVKAEAGNEQE